MKLIHCADIHLDSKLDANLSKTDSKMRRNEILDTFLRMVDYASNNQVKGILISGDLFDGKNVSALAKNMVKSAIDKHPQIYFFYLKGNHDDETLLDFFEKIPSNLFLFNDKWKQYVIGDKIAIHGVELNEKNSLSVQSLFAPDPSLINIVMLHGQDMEATCVERAEVINLKLFRNKGINYMALGHIHGYRVGDLDGYGKYCYCGCLEGRGFDEIGEHGFVLLDIDEENGIIHDEFIPFANRKLFEVDADVSNLNNTSDMIDKVRDMLIKSQARSSDLVKIVLKGFVDVESEKDTEFIRHTFEGDYFFLKVYDKTKIKIDPKQYMLDTSLKGEFVRNVWADESLNEDEKGEIIKMGLNALAGGRIEL